MCGMAHNLIYSLVSDLVQRVGLCEPIVEFGALQVEAGQPNNLRPLFAGRPFIGTDFRDGPGVDRIEDLRSLRFADGEVGTALCLDTLEHCADPLSAGRELRRVVNPDGGVCLISSVMLMPIHAYPADYWRFTPEGFRLVLEGFDHIDVAGWGDPEIPFWVFGLASRGRALDVRLADLPSFASGQADYDRSRGQVKLGPFRYTLRQLATDLSGELPRALREQVAAKLARR